MRPMLLIVATGQDFESLSSPVFASAASYGLRIAMSNPPFDISQKSLPSTSSKSTFGFPKLDRCAYEQQKELAHMKW